ncbi:MAG: serine/threonine protein kinase [Deltaproteobacteria bacterium]|nr:serine/threonine protein kinase [Deltaproteobacteria bacterium]
MSEEVHADDLIDRRFRLRRKIGVGGFGTVWLAHDDETRAPVALKLLHPQHKRKPRTLERFVREAQVLTGLRHANIANALAFSAEGPVPYIAMEFAPGHTLSAEITARARRAQAGGAGFEPGEIRGLLEALVAPVSHAHKKGVVHRDLKPENVVVFIERGKLRLKILDFGIAKILEDTAAMKTTVGRVFGSLFYMSPEQARGETVDARADVFGIGAILFELLTLRRAWARTSDDAPLSVLEPPTASSLPNKPLQVMQRISEGPRPRPSAWCDEIGSAEDELVLRSMALRPSDRFQSADDLLDAARAAFPASLDETGPTLSAAEEATEAHSRESLLLATDPHVRIDTHPTHDDSFEREEEDPTRVGLATDRPAWVDPFLAEVQKGGEPEASDREAGEGTERSMEVPRLALDSAGPGPDAKVLSDPGGVRGSDPKVVSEPGTFRSGVTAPRARPRGAGPSPRVIILGGALVVAATALVTIGVITRLRESQEQTPPPSVAPADEASVRAVAAAREASKAPAAAQPDSEDPRRPRKFRIEVSRLEEILEETRKHPTESSVQTLADAIFDASRALADAAARRQVQGCAKSGKLEELAACMERLAGELEAEGGAPPRPKRP